MRLDLHDLGLRAGGRYEGAYTIAVDPIFLGGAEYQVVLPEGATLCVDRVAGGFLIALEFEGMVYGPCARCLREVEVPVHTSQQEFAPTATGDWEESEISVFLKDAIVDVGGLVREAVVLALPTQVLCSSGCMGLCPECGQDLNKGACGCGG